MLTIGIVSYIQHQTEDKMGNSKIITRAGENVPDTRQQIGQDLAMLFQALAQATPQARAQKEIERLKSQYDLADIIAQQGGQDLYQTSLGNVAPPQKNPLGVNLGKVGNTIADVLTLGLGRPLQQTFTSLPKADLTGAKPKETKTVGDILGKNAINDLPLDIQNIASLTLPQTENIYGKGFIGDILKLQERNLAQEKLIIQRLNILADKENIERDSEERKIIMQYATQSAMEDPARYNDWGNTDALQWLVEKHFNNIMKIIRQQENKSGKKTSNTKNPSKSGKVSMEDINNAVK